MALTLVANVRIFSDLLNFNKEYCRGCLDGFRPVAVWNLNKKFAI